MSDVSEVSEEQPVFDFSEISYGWAKQYSRVVTKIASAGVLLEAKSKDGITPDEQVLLNASKMEAIAGWDDLISERDRLLVRPLVSVPRTWLVKSAPKDIDWDDPASLEWLRGDRIDDILSALNAARSNSQKK